jgi:hypothetical protein
MKNLTTISDDLFHKIRTRFSDMKIGDKDGALIMDPKNARFFDFTYSSNGKKLGRVNIKIDDKSLTVIYDTNMNKNQAQSVKTEWFDFLKDLRQFSKKNMLNFDTRDITKSNLSKRDYQYLAQESGESKMSESKLFGTSKTSYQDMGEAKIIVKHSAPINYNNPAGRTQRIESIYVESPTGERFRYPHRHLNGARALARHVANGGTAYDDIGNYISGLSEELGKLRQFRNYVSRNEMMSEAFGDLSNRVLERIDQIKIELRDIQKQQQYDQFKNNFQSPQTAPVPEETANQWVEALTIKSFNEDLKSTFPYIYKLMIEKRDDEITYEDFIDEESIDSSEDINEDPMFTEFEQQMDDITTFDYDVGEGKMSDIDIDLQSLADRGDEEDLIAALEGDLGPGTADVLQNMMDEIKDELAAKGMNDIINDYDKMIEILWDKIVDEYGGRDDSGEDMFNDSQGEKDKKNNDDLPFEPDENPTDKDEFGNTIKHRAKHLAKKGMRSMIPKEVVEYVASMYDRESGTFPRGEEGVKIAVEKKFGEQAGQFAHFVVEKLSAKNQNKINVDPELQELSRMRELAGMQQEGDRIGDMSPEDDPDDVGDSFYDEDYVYALASRVFKMNPNLSAKGRGDEVVDAAYEIMVNDLGKKRASYILRYDPDFTGELLDTYSRAQHHSKSKGENVQNSSPEVEDIRRLSGLQIEAGDDQEGIEDLIAAADEEYNQPGRHIDNLQDVMNATIDADDSPEYEKARAIINRYLELVTNTDVDHYDADNDDPSAPAIGRMAHGDIARHIREYDLGDYLAAAINMLTKMARQSEGLAPEVEDIRRLSGI